MKISHILIFGLLALWFAFASPGCRQATTDAEPEQPTTERVLATAKNSDWVNLKRYLIRDESLASVADADEATLLHLAAERAKDDDIIRFLLEFPGLVERTDDEGHSALFYAARNPSVSVLECLVAAGADWRRKRRDANENEIVLVAVRYNPNPAVLEKLFEFYRPESLASMLGSAGRNLVHEAARWNPRPEIIDTLCRHGGNPNGTDSRVTPLHHAIARNPNPEVVEALVRNGAIVDRHTTLSDRERERREKYLASRPDLLPNERSRVGPGERDSHLHYAAKFNRDVRVSKFLIEHGADPLIRNADGRTPAEYAIRCGKSREVVVFHVDAHIEKSPAPDAALKLLCDAIVYAPDATTVAYLARRVPDVNALYRGRPPLHYATEKQDRYPMIDVLVENGADLHIKGRHDETIFEIGEFLKNAEPSYDDSLKRYLKKFKTK